MLACVGACVESLALAEFEDPTGEQLGGCMACLPVLKNLRLSKSDGVSVEADWHSVAWPGLTSLTLDGLLIDAHAFTFVPSFSATLESLDITVSPLSPKDIASTVSFTTSLPSLAALKISNTSFAFATLIMQSLHHTKPLPPLSHVDLRLRDWSSSTARSLLDAVDTFLPTLRSVNVANHTRGSPYISPEVYAGRKLDPFYYKSSPASGPFTRAKLLAAALHSALDFGSSYVDEMLEEGKVVELEKVRTVLKKLRCCSESGGTDGQLWCIRLPPLPRRYNLPVVGRPRGSWRETESEAQDRAQWPDGCNTKMLSKAHNPSSSPPSTPQALIQRSQTVKKEVSAYSSSSRS